MGDKLRRKLVVVGDSGCGKSTLLTMFRTGKFDKVFVANMHENHVVDITIDSKEVELSLWDTMGREYYDRLRPLSYPNTDVVLICFSIDKSNSLGNVVTKRLPEVIHFCSTPATPYILVGCKMDLRTYIIPEIAMFSTTGRSFVTVEEGEEVAQRIGAMMYLECSSKINQNVELVLEKAARTALLAKKHSRTVQSKCVVL